MTFSKQEIKNRVTDNLFWDARIDGSAITVELVDGTVVLSGEASSFLARQAAEEDTWIVPGVVSVENNIIIRKLSVAFPQDAQIKSAILTFFKYDNNIESSNILVSVENGTVTIDGSVPALWQKLRVEELVTEVNGVVMVHNQLTVVPERHFIDELIARDIIAAIDRNLLVTANKIDVQVNDGKVVLSGSVSSFAAFKSVEYIAKQTDGVIEIVNDLMVVNK